MAGGKRKTAQSQGDHRGNLQRHFHRRIQPSGRLCLAAAILSRCCSVLTKAQAWQSFYILQQLRWHRLVSIGDSCALTTRRECGSAPCACVESQSPVKLENTYLLKGLSMIHRLKKYACTR
jgi:hypothetical protein